MDYASQMAWVKSGLFFRRTFRRQRGTVPAWDVEAFYAWSIARGTTPTIDTVEQFYEEKKDAPN